MKEIFIADKQKFLNENYPFNGDPPAITLKVKCMHCGEVVIVGDYKVFQEEGDDFQYIYCPNAPECDGTVIDWVDVDFPLNSDTRKRPR